MNLLDRNPVRGRWFSHLNLEFGSQHDGFGPATLLQHRDSQRCGFETDSAVTSTECRIPDRAVKLTALADRRNARLHVADQPIKRLFPYLGGERGLREERSRSIGIRDTNASLVSRREAMADAFAGDADVVPLRTAPAW
jgi:hypothetical protein